MTPNRRSCWCLWKLGKKKGLSNIMIHTEEERERERERKKVVVPVYVSLILSKRWMIYKQGDLPFVNTHFFFQQILNLFRATANFIKYVWSNLSNRLKQLKKYVLQDKVDEQIKSKYIFHFFPFCLCVYFDTYRLLWWITESNAHGAHYVWKGHTSVEIFIPKRHNDITT